MIRRVRNARAKRAARRDASATALATATATESVLTIEERDGEAELRLAEIPLREVVELVRIDLPAEQMEPLLELGLLPGCQVCPVRRSPFGDPVLMVEGALIAVRREMAGCLCVRRAIESGAN